MLVIICLSVRVVAMCILDVVSVLMAYMLGSVCTGYYLVRVRKGLDIRNEGSGGVGARNVGRLLGRFGFIVTLSGDIAKGVLAIAIALYFASSPMVVSLAFVAVILGHVKPLFIRFRGGRGVATAIGAYMLYMPIVLLFFGIIFGLLLLARRGVINSGIVAFALLPLVAIFLRMPIDVVIAILSSSIIVVTAHKKYVLLMFKGSGVRV